MMKPDSFSASLESFSSDLQLFDVAGQKEVQIKSDSEESMSFSPGNKIEHMVGKQSQEADRIWEPGGFLDKPDRGKLQAVAVVQRQAVYEPAIDETLVEYDASLIEAATVPNPDPFVKPLEHVATAWLSQALWNCLDKHLEHGEDELRGTQRLMVNKKMSFKDDMLLQTQKLHMKFEAAVEIFLWEQHNSSCFTIRNVLEVKRLHEMNLFLCLQCSETPALLPTEIRDGLVTTVNYTRPFAINKVQSGFSLKDWVAQGMRSSCVVIGYEDATQQEVTQTCLLLPHDALFIIPNGPEAKDVLKYDYERFGSRGSVYDGNTLESVFAVLVGDKWYGEKFVCAELMLSTISRWGEPLRTRKEKCSMSWRFKFKDKSKEHKLTAGLIVLKKQRTVNLSSVTCLGLNGDNQLLLDGIADDNRVLVEKLVSVDTYSKARFLLELIHMEFIGGKAHGKGLLVAGHIVLSNQNFCKHFHRKIHLEEKLSAKKQKCDVRDDPYKNNFHDSLVLMVLGQAVDGDNSVVLDTPFMAICKIGEAGHDASHKQRSYDRVIKWKLRKTYEAEVSYGFHSRWDFTAVVAAEWRRPRAHFHSADEEMVCSRDTMHLVDGLRNCIHCFEAECVWDPGGLSAKAAHLGWPETYQNRGGTSKSTVRFHETCIQSFVLLLKAAKEIEAGYEWLISTYSCHKTNTVKELVGYGITKGFTENINWANQGMLDHADFNQFLFGIEMFQVKHKWRYKPLPIVSEVELKDEAAVDTRNEEVLSCYTTGQDKKQERYKDET
ncbi:hypothetical protein Bca101_043717 [Brassica carinata]